MEKTIPNSGRLLQKVEDRSYSAMWKCKKCGRKFKRKGQSHSCSLVSESEHFKGKKAALRPLYTEFLKRLRKKIGPFRIEALNCCIHLVTTFTFAAVYTRGDQLRICFSSDKQFDSPRIRTFQRFSANRYMYEVNIKDSKEIDSELLGWLEHASVSAGDR